MKNQSTDENRYVRIERVRNVTIYRRGRAYYLYFREGKRSVRRRVGNNIAEARAAASGVAAALAEKRPSPIGFRRITFCEFADGFIVYARDVRRLAPRTVERYRAAMRLLKEFAGEAGIGHPEALQAPAVEDFVRWLRSRGRSRNGRAAGKIESYKTGGIRFVLGVARTAYNWAARRRHLPPYSENPFGSFPIEELRDRGEGSPATRPMSGSELEAFFRACDDWQRPVFLVLAVYGMRVGELTHLLVEDVDLDAGTVSIRSKPELFWYVKTGRERVLPVFEEMRSVFEKAIGGRRGGFVFLNEHFAKNPGLLPVTFASPGAFRERMLRVAEEARAMAAARVPRGVTDISSGETGGLPVRPGKSDKPPGLEFPESGLVSGGISGDLPALPEADRAAVRAVTEECRRLGQIPEKRIRQEYMKLTRRIGRPDLTRAHDLRHLCASRAQEAGLSPIMVAELLGHRTLEMTRRYTHLGLEARREALRRVSSGLLDLAASASRREA